jgi:tetratricopeptide (TPR) repeat protein
MKQLPGVKGKGGANSTPPVVLAPGIDLFLKAHARACQKEIPVKEESPSMKTEGSEKLFIELEKKPEEVVAYASKYNELVADITSIIKNEYGKPSTEQFITGVWGIISSNLGIQYGQNVFGFMYESMGTGKFDCDTSSFLVYDVAKQLGLDVKIVSVPPKNIKEGGHVVVAFPEFYFETTSGKYYPPGIMQLIYPIKQVLTESQIQSVTYFDRGVAYYKQGNLTQAIEDYTHAIKLNPEYADAYYNRACMYEKIGEKLLAEKDRRMYFDVLACLASSNDYTQAVNLNPNHANAYYDLGLAYYKQGNLTQAIEDYNKAIELNPNLAEAYNNRGVAYDDQGNFKQAIEDFSKAIELNPNLAVAYYNRAEAYGHQGNVKQAIKDYTQAIKLNPKDAEAYDNRAAAYEKIGKTDLAEKDRETYKILMEKEKSR